MDRSDDIAKIRSFSFVVVVLLLVSAGLLLMYSASYYEAISFGYDHWYFLVRQAFFALLALFASFVIVLLPRKLFQFMVYPMLAVSFILMILTLFTPFGQTKLGATRWLKIGPLPSFQPSEIVKFVIVFYLAQFFSSDKHRISGYISCIAIVMTFALLILMQRDYSTTIVYLGICFFMFVVGGFPVLKLLIAAAFAAVPAVCVMLIEPYRVKRIASFLMPDLDPSGLNYQVTNSLNAIKAGGLFGVGLGNGQYKLGVIPEVQSDFIFASIFEELGLFGSLFIIILFVLFAMIGISCFRRLYDHDRFYSFAAFGLTMSIVIQVIVNLGVVLGLLPPTGIPLPFFSQGGTNLFIVICESAIIYKSIRMERCDNEDQQNA